MFCCSAAAGARFTIPRWCLQEVVGRKTTTTTNSIEGFLTSFMSISLLVYSNTIPLYTVVRYKYKYMSMSNLCGPIYIHQLSTPVVSNTLGYYIIRERAWVILLAHERKNHRTNDRDKEKGTLTGFPEDTSLSFRQSVIKNNNFNYKMIFNYQYMFNWLGWYFWNKY